MVTMSALTMSAARRDELAAVSLFRGLSPRALERVDALGTELEVRAGRTLTTEGAAAREAFVILHGDVEVVARGRRVATVGAGDVLGEMALVDNRPRTATARALTDVRVLVLDVRGFWSLLEEPLVAERVLELASARRSDG